jgi:hypothetical protein
MLAAGGTRLINTASLERTALVGTVTQLLMFVVGHFIPWVAANVFGFGSMMIAATAGYLYAREVEAGYARGALGGAVVGGLCALLGLFFAFSLHDVDRLSVLVGTLSAILTGAVGGVFGELSTRTA